MGDDNPETLTALSNLGFVYQDMDDLEQAERYTRAALEGQRRVLGASPPALQGILLGRADSR